MVLVYEILICVLMVLVCLRILIPRLTGSQSWCETQMPFDFLSCIQFSYFYIILFYCMSYDFILLHQCSILLISIMFSFNFLPNVSIILPSINSSYSGRDPITIFIPAWLLTTLNTKWKLAPLPCENHMFSIFHWPHSNFWLPILVTTEVGLIIWPTHPRKTSQIARRGSWWYQWSALWWVHLHRQTS